MNKLLKQLSSWAAKKLSTLVIACNDTQSHNRGVLTMMRLRNKSAMTEQVNNHSTTRRAAFTLAEVLITLAIIGVVAALTIPSLISSYKERVAIVRLKQTYSTFSEAYKYAQIENGNPQTWDIGTADSPAGALKLYNIFKPYLRKIKDCELSSGCFAEHYKALFNDDWAWQPATHSVYARGILANGVSFFMWTNGTGCNDSCGAIGVDINGIAGPNRAGEDYFEFTIYPEGIFPSGQKTKTNSNGHKCVYKDTSTVNGVYCTYWAISKGNMDYLRRDIDSEW